MGLLLPSSFFLPLFPSGFRGDDVKNAINETLRVLYVGFHRHVCGGGRAKHVKNHSHRLEVFIHHLVADSRDVFRLKNYVPAGTHVEDMADSLQIFLSPRKTYGSTEPLYLNLSKNKF